MPKVRRAPGAEEVAELHLGEISLECSRAGAAAAATWATFQCFPLQPDTGPRFRAGLIQMACSADPNENMAKAEWKIREAAGGGAQGMAAAGVFSTLELFTGTRSLS